MKTFQELSSLPHLVNVGHMVGLGLPTSAPEVNIPQAVLDGAIVERHWIWAPQGRRGRECCPCTSDCANGDEDGKVFSPTSTHSLE